MEGGSYTSFRSPTKSLKSLSIRLSNGVTKECFLPKRKINVFDFLKISKKWKKRRRNNTCLNQSFDNNWFIDFSYYKLRYKSSEEGSKPEEYLINTDDNNEENINFTFPQVYHIGNNHMNFFHIESYFDEISSIIGCFVLYSYT